jgi:cysteine desulfurase
MKRIYLDHTATTPLDPRVLDVMLPFFSETFGNASSVHSFGREARSALERAREVVAAAVGAKPGELFFTSGGTESDNLAVLGAAGAARKNGRSGVVTSAAEHHAVLDACEALRDQGFDVSILPVDGAGRVDPDAIRRAAEGAGLVTVMHANNEVGTIGEFPALAEAAHAKGAVVHTDAVQTLGRIPVNVDELGVDLLSLSAHKMYGPKGIGALYVRSGTALEPVFRGGGQERGRRPGTESVAAAVGFAKAVELALAERPGEMQRLASLRDSLQTRLLSEFNGIIVNGHADHHLPHILNISFDAAVMPMEGEMLVPAMDLRGVAVTSGSACTSGSIQPSHVLRAMGRDPATAKATLRFSFGRSNSATDLDPVVEALRGAVSQARKS